MEIRARGREALEISLKRLFRYSGNKLPFIKEINKIINKTDKKIYIEPFIGSGAVLFNLNKKFDSYIVNDIDENIICIYNTFKKIEYVDYINELVFIEEKFGDIKTSKENYYEFRNWFNKNHWKTKTNKEGIYLHMLANACINSFLRFSPNGMNQSFGNRFYKLDRNTFNNIKEVLKKTTILNMSYQEVMKRFKNVENDILYFLDPPYQAADSSYASFSENDIIEFIKIIEEKSNKIDFVYTDIKTKYNDKFSYKVLREMVNTSPNSKGDIKRGNSNIECVFSNLDLNEEILDEW
jgi:DNA adenine methylase Dam